jgi:hypothetical protein
MIKKTIFAATIALLLVPTIANAQSASELGDEWHACLAANSITYGDASCLAPSELLPAVYSKCQLEAENIRKWLIAKHDDKLATETMKDVRDRMLPELTALIVDGQIRRGTCP